MSVCHCAQCTRRETNIPVVLVSPAEHLSFIQAAINKRERWLLWEIRIKWWLYLPHLHTNIHTNTHTIHSVRLDKYHTHYLTSICPGVRAACPRTAASAGETPPRSWHRGPFPSAPGRTSRRGAACTDVRSTAATSARSPCSTRWGLRKQRDVSTARKPPAATTVNDRTLRLSSHSGQIPGLCVVFRDFGV